MASNVLDDLGAYLQTAGVAVLGTSLFKGAIPLDVPSVAVHDSLLALIEVPGLPPERVHNSRDDSIEQPMIQVICRGLPHDYVDARDRAQAAWLALDGLTNVVLSGTSYLWIYAMQSPFRLPPDEMARPRVAFNIRIGKSLVGAAPLVPLTSFVQPFVNQTSLTILGSIHRLGTRALVWAMYDTASPAALVAPGRLTIHPTTFDVTIAFPTPQSGRLVLSAVAVPGYRRDFTGQTAVTILGSEHGLGTRDLIPAFYDDATPAAVIEPQRCTVHPSSYDVVVTFAVAQSGSVVLYGAV